jgi:hypothetical protein
MAQFDSGFGMWVTQNATAGKTRVWSNTTGGLFAEMLSGQFSVSSFWI